MSEKQRDKTYSKNPKDSRTKTLSRRYQQALEEAYNPCWSEDSIRFINNPSPRAQNSFLYVQECGQFHVKAPYYTERKNLNSYLIVYTKSGDGILRLEDKNYRCTPGTIFFIDCRIHHRYSCEPDSEWDFLWLHFNGIPADGYFREFARAMAPVIPLNDFRSEIEKHLTALLSLSMSTDSGSELLIACEITQLLTKIILNLDQNINLPPMPKHIIKEVNSFLSDNFFEPVTLDQLSHRFGISKYYLSRTFKQCTGQTIHECLESHRIRFAKELLRSDTLTVDEIAEQCGYRYTSHFIHVFCRHEQQTPLQYRKQWGNIRILSKKAGEN